MRRRDRMRERRKRGLLRPTISTPVLPGARCPDTGRIPSRPAMARETPPARESSRRLGAVSMGARPTPRGSARARVPVVKAANGRARVARLTRARPARQAFGIVKILLVSQMYRGPDDPDLGGFVQGGEGAL